MGPQTSKPRTNSARVPAVLVQVPLSVVLLSWLGRSLRSLAGGLFRRSWLLWLPGLVSLAVWLMVTDGLAGVVGLVAGALLVLSLWRAVGRDSFRRVVQRPVLGGWRLRRVYRPQWQLGMTACGLSSRVGGVEHLPRILGVASSLSVDEVRVAMVPGQVMGDYVAVVDRLAQTFGAVDARVRSVPGRPNELVLWFLSRDPLVNPVPGFRPMSAPDLEALSVGVCEDGVVYRLRLLGTHLLLVGATGAGKSSVVWSLLYALSPAIAAGMVSLWVIDPKGGMELSAGRRLFARFCHGDSIGAGSGPAVHELSYAELLEDAVAVMRDRQARLRGVSRLHQPSSEEPLIVVVVDELASLTSYVTDRDAKRRISAALSLLLSQGRAVGVLVVAALQDPRKEVLPSRDLFPTRIALRLTDADQVDMVLGDGARSRGARCDRIPESLPGVGYVALDGVAEPVRVRFSYLSDEDINRICAEFTRTVEGAGPDRGEAA